MSNEEEKRCPLCAEEMDWTDQQFKPCKCGYQVCVWCWHHIIDMAEKDGTEGRCPACRAIYEKDKVVAMQANCERTGKKSSNRKTKPPKAKPKTDEVKKDLLNVRVIQRKMAYVIGLPLSLADEDLLLRKEYFGQYGKVTKVSLSRTAGGAIQQFINDTCSVYITYSKEEEALQCIQSVHGFVLEGRFLRASFGTAKYCHAWLKNMPCNNPACLYLHSIGSDEDSFGKDEVAAVHTRSRVQQIVGAANNVVKRSGNVLPPAADYIYSSTYPFSDKSTDTSLTYDATHGSVNNSSDLTGTIPPKENEGGIAVPRKVTSFVDVVGRSNSSVPGKDGSIEDRWISDLSTQLSSVTSNEDIRAREPYSVNTMFKVSSSNCIGSGLFRSTPDESLRKDILSFDNHGSKDTCRLSQSTCFLHPYYPANISEDPGGPTLLHKKTHSVNDFRMDHTLVQNCQDEASSPIRFVNSLPNDSCREMKFQNSAKSDRICRSSNSFSDEEIVEHLRRIDDDNLTKCGENSTYDAVESSIISNILSIDFESCEDSLTLPNGLSGLLGETGSSWKSLNGDQSRYSVGKQEAFASHSRSMLPHYGHNKEQYSCKPQYPVSRAQCSGPPGFSVPSRYPPPGFSTCDRTDCLARPSSGSSLVNASSSSNTLLQPPSTGFGSSFGAVDFLDPAKLCCVKGKPTNGLKSPGFDTRRAGTGQLSTFEDDSRRWLSLKQSTSTCQDSKFSHMFVQQTPSIQLEPSYTENCLSGLDDIYCLSSRLVDQVQNYDACPLAQMSQPKSSNGHISNTNGYWQSLDDVQCRGEICMRDPQRNERFGANNYFPGYGDLMFSSGDIYTKVFGL
ncbi:putative general negative regulator of transcription C16 [Sesamum alatum]|uniref:General negative regulator of transcription C16 n=1 Tax=Sesamum alatum TaxID=300844 RepID=A0AAE2CVI6_9LAMI|nr:putative general negative regulator of transcription C16 [Sesamum alatum]